MVDLNVGNFVTIGLVALLFLAAAKWLENYMGWDFAWL